MARAKNTTSETPRPDEAPAAAEGEAPEAAPAPEPAGPEAADKLGRKRRAREEAEAGEPGEIHVEAAEHALGALADEEAASAGPAPSAEAVAELADSACGMETPEPEPTPGTGEGQATDFTGAEPLAEAPLAASGAPAARPEQGSGGGFVAGLIGGALAIAAGVGALWLSNPDLLRGEAPQPDLSPLEARLDSQAADTAALGDDLTRLAATVEALPETPEVPDTAALEARVAALEGDTATRLEALGAEVEALSASLAVLEGRVGQVEVRPPVMEGDAAAATDQVVAEMRAALDAQRAEIEALVDEARGRIESAQAEAEAIQATAEDAARAAVARASYARLQAALEAGGPFAAALSELSEVVDGPIPPALIAAADTGVPTLADLRRAYPEAARAALAASIRAGMPEDAGAMDRFGAFLRSQTGARSTAPRAGDNPDAVLSRAEAALTEGQVAAAVMLLDALPEAGQAEMAAWRTQAEARLTAVEAAEALAAALPAN
ncbi:MAG: hypothetical protein OEM24_00560 [Paracoccaceae bacterium]|nr:hypothetical protein [Paracoccaceae bacterium]